MIVLAVCGWVFAVLALAGGGYTLLAAFFVCRFPRCPAAPIVDCPPVTVLKPLHGTPPRLEACLDSIFRQDYPAPLQIVFGVGTETDPAAQVVAGLCGRHPEVDAGLTVGYRKHGLNAKVSNLINMADSARHEVLVVSDDDIDVPVDYLRLVTAALEPRDVAAVSCLYTGEAAGGAGSRFSALRIDYGFLPSAIAGLALGLAHPCMGSTIAVKRRMLDEIGGFAAVADHLADDYEIGRRLREKGYRVVVPPLLVRHACGEGGIGEWFGHELRWARTIRISDPAGHWGSLVTHPVPLALMACALAGFTMTSIGILAATLAARAVLKWQVDKRFGCDGGPHWLLPAGDILSFGAYVLSLFGSRIEWRGEHLRVGSGGILTKD
jgi:ceramide glucosyltransferase